MGQKANDLALRISTFAVAVLKLVRRLPRDVAADTVIRQVARSAGGVSSNYRAACCARSRTEFVAKLGVTVEEADETTHWLWMAQQLDLARGRDFDEVLSEARQIQAILSTSLSTSRRNLRLLQEAEKSGRRRPL
jgi:four helix bundle protein